jgi:hypothetical protein
MKGNVVVKIILCLALVGIIAALGGIAYQAGVVSGLAQSGQGEAAKGLTTPYMYHHGMFGIPFIGVFSFIIPLILICMAFSVLRCIFWGGRWGWRHMYRHGPWGMYPGDRWDWDKDTPPFFDEWHRRAHEKRPDETAEKNEV